MRHTYLRGQLCGLLLLTMAITKERYKTEQNETATIDPHWELKCGRVVFGRSIYRAFVAVDPNKARACSLLFVSLYKPKEAKEATGEKRTTIKPTTDEGREEHHGQEGKHRTHSERERKRRPRRQVRSLSASK